MHGFQIWVNLPASLKLTQPRYQEVPASRIPMAETADGKAHVKVIAGEALGARAVIETHTPIVYQDWTLEPGSDVVQPIAADHQVVAYVFEGEVVIAGQRVRDGQMACGAPRLQEGCCYSPEYRFASPSRGMVRSAIRDYQTGRMGGRSREPHECCEYP